MSLFLLHVRYLTNVIGHNDNSYNKEQYFKNNVYNCVIQLVCSVINCTICCCHCCYQFISACDINFIVFVYHLLFVKMSYKINVSCLPQTLYMRASDLSVRLSYFDHVKQLVECFQYLLVICNTRIPVSLSFFCNNVQWHWTQIGHGELQSFYLSVFSPNFLYFMFYFRIISSCLFLETNNTCSLTSCRHHFGVLVFISYDLFWNALILKK